jgi:ribosomal protein S3AE
MSNVKEKMTEIIQSQSDDVTYDEIMRELAFERMIEQGLDDSRIDQFILNQEAERQILT